MLNMRFNNVMLPFLVSLGGIITDYLTTNIGLNLGYYETHANYHPLNALVIFSMAIFLLTAILPEKKVWKTSIICLASATYLGTVNNLLVIQGVFSGLII
jgi:hypothetical protein